MNIATFLRKFPAYSETYPLWHIVELARGGNSVTIHAARKGNPGELQTKDPHFFLNTSVRYLVDKGVTKRSFLNDDAIKTFSGVVHCMPELFNARSRRNILRRLSWHRHGLRKQRYDIAHAYFGNNALVAMELGKAGFVKAPLVVSFLGYDVTTLPLKFGEQMYKDLFRYSEALCVSSDFIGERLSRLGAPEAKIKKIPIGLPIASMPIRASLKPAGRPLQAISVGRLEPVKGMEYAISAVSLSRSNGLDIRLNIYGDGSEKENLLKLIKKLGLSDSVTLLGSQSHDEVISGMLKSDLLLYTGATQPNGAEEGLGGSIIEAQAMGLPVVATKVGGVSEAFLDSITGVSVPAENIEAIADGIVRVREMLEARPNLSEEAREHSAFNYDSKVLHRRWMALYESLL